MGTALSHSVSSQAAGAPGNASMPPSTLPAAEKSRREIFEERSRPIARVYPYISLREDEQDGHHPIASTSKAGFPVPETCSYRTLDDFRAQDKDRKGRLRKLFNTLRQEWALPHDHTGYTTHSRQADLLEKDGRPLTADEKRVEVINKEYLNELYHSLCPGDEAAKGKGPSFERFTQFVEAKEQGEFSVCFERWADALLTAKLRYLPIGSTMGALLPYRQRQGYGVDIRGAAECLIESRYVQCSSIRFSSTSVC